MANKFLGEAGLTVLVEEIKKKAQSEQKPLFEIFYENDTNPSSWPTEDNITKESAIRYLKTGRCAGIFWHDIINHAHQLFGLDLTSIQSDLNAKLTAAESAATAELYKTLMDDFISTTLLVDEELTISLRDILDDNEFFICSLAHTQTTIMYDSDAKQILGRNPYGGNWEVVPMGTTVEEISADEVNNKFNS